MARVVGLAASPLHFWRGMSDARALQTGQEFFFISKVAVRRDKVLARVVNWKSKADVEDNVVVLALVGLWWVSAVPGRSFFNILSSVSPLCPLHFGHLRGCASSQLEYLASNPY